jgi:transposase-like protein
MGNCPVSNETASSEDPGAAVSDVEPAVLSCAQLRNRECLRAWRRRHQEHQAASGEEASVPLNRGRTAAALAGTRDLKWWPRAHG